MHGLMMDYDLTLTAILKRADLLFGNKEIVSRLPDKSFHRYTYADFTQRAKKLSLALQKLGVQSGDRVGTLCWNHHQHLEAYFGIPAAGAVLHTLNLRLSPEDLTYIANHAADKVILVDKVLLPLLEKFKDKIQTQHFVVISEEGGAPEGMLDYEQLLAEVDEADFSYPEIDEKQAAAICYTSGTTGRPKGVLYTHRALVLHSLAALTADLFGLREVDVVLPVVPMFHANAWGIPYAATMAGSNQVFPGPFLDPESLLDAIEQERVTFTAGVPTIWLGILAILEKYPNRWKLPEGVRMPVGGSAVPEALLRNMDKFGLRIVQAWGMTETSPIGSYGILTGELQNAPIDEQYSYRALQGRPAPFIEFRIRNDEGLAPWDGKSMGELEIHGAWVASAYYNAPEGADRFTEDGWFKTGDIVSIDQRGYMKIQDRSKDLIKSGGEWISSVDLENALMGHPKVAEAAVIAVPHPKWQERPLGVVVLKEGQNATQAELIEFLTPKFARWWLPDAIEFVEAIPRTATGKFLKLALRQQFTGYTLPVAVEAGSAD